MSAQDCPILVISSTNATRKALEALLQGQGGTHAFCSTFKAAEQLALVGEYSGILVDLTTMIKAKDEEKIIACSLVNVYPTLRVRAMGATLVPMTMPGVASPESSLNDFLQETCAAFVSRRLRAHKRYEICAPAMSLAGGVETRCVIQNLSWGGAFIVDMHPERLAVGDEITITLMDFALPVRVVVDWVQPWGERRMPGYGVHFSVIDDALRVVLDRLLPIGSEQAQDRRLG